MCVKDGLVLDEGKVFIFLFIYYYVLFWFFFCCFFFFWGGGGGGGHLGKFLMLPYYSCSHFPIRSPCVIKVAAFILPSFFVKQCQRLIYAIDVYLISQLQQLGKTFHPQ